MFNKKIILMVCVASLFGAGCSTMYFHNGQSASQVDRNEWHHDGIFRLVEFSSPVDLNDRCEGKAWDTVKVEETFIQGLARNLTYNLYDPWDVSYSCK